MTLRDQCVEAAARQLSIDICGYDESDDVSAIAQHRREAEAAFDAILDTLEANAAEWADYRAVECHSDTHYLCPSDAQVKGLIQSLRNPNVEEETHG